MKELRVKEVVEDGEGRRMSDTALEARVRPVNLLLFQVFRLLPVLRSVRSAPSSTVSPHFSIK